MHILVPNLHEDRTTLREQVPGHGEAIPQVRQVRVNAVAPCVTKGLDLFRFAGDVAGVAVPDVPAGSGPLEVRVEPDAVGRVEVDTLHLAAQSFALGEGGHHLQAVTEDHAIGPVGVVLVEFGAGVFIRQPVEVGKEVELRGCFRFPAVANQIVDQHLGVNFFLDVEWWRLHEEVRHVLFVLASPDELGIEVTIATLVGNPERVAVVPFHDSLVLGCGDVFTRRITVSEVFHLFIHIGCPGHGSLLCNYSFSRSVKFLE